MRLAVLALAGTCGSTTAPAAAPVDAAPVERRVTTDAPPAEAVEDDALFHAVAEVAVEEDESAPHFRLFHAGDALFVTIGPRVIPVGPDGDLELDRSWAAGIETTIQDDTMSLAGMASWDVIAAGGRWPDAFFITIVTEDGTRGGVNRGVLYRRDDDRWVAVDTAARHFSWFAEDIARWRDGSVIALRGFDPIFGKDIVDPTPASLRRFESTIRRQPTLVAIVGGAKAPVLRRDVNAIDGLESGEIVGVVEGERPVAVHYDPERNATVERRLPQHDLVHAEVVLEGPSAAWIYGRLDGEEDAPYLARFDGASWIEESAPACDGEGLGSFTRAPDGDTWAICGEPPEIARHDSGKPSLWHRASDDAAWERVALPGVAAPTQVVARSRDDVWVAGDVLFHTRSRDRVASLPGYTDLWLDVLEAKEPAPAFSCPHGTILVKGSPDGAHEDLVGALGRALSGVEHEGTIALVEVSFRGKPRLAIQHHIAQGRNVAERVRQVLGDRMLETYCVFREPTRELGSW